MLRIKMFQFVAVTCCLMAFFPPFAQALTFDSTYYAVVRERDVALAQLETLRQSHPDIQKVLDDERKTIANTREELRAEQRTSAKWRGFTLWGVPLGCLVGVLIGTAIGNTARRAHAQVTSDRRDRDDPGRK
ncbi:MAG: hypothetical protein FWD61_13160 [Phycisphaerales bacterium]|nr:hypothetical protein [Phycisphaerales bacterium]